MSRNRLEYLDLYRAMAILAVLVIHTTSDAKASLPRESTFYPVYLAVNAAAQFAVPAFLFLSSLVLFYNYDGRTGINWRTFYMKRVSTIIIPYLLWSLFYFLLKHGLTISENWPAYFKGLLDGSNYTHLYFIVILLQLFLLFPLFLGFVRLRFARSHLIVFGIVLQTAFYLGNYYFFHINKVGTFAGSYLLYFFLGAYAGILLKSSDTWITKSNQALSAAFLLLAAGYIAQEWLQVFSPHYIPQPWLSLINFVSVYGYAGVCCFWLIHVSARLFARGRLVRRFLISLGIASFGVYLIHPLILYIWRAKVMMNGPILYHVLTWAGGAAALIVSWFITAFLQRTRWGSLILGREKAVVKGAKHGG